MSQDHAHPVPPADVLIDAHVHLHPEHRLASVYQNASIRFRRADPNATGVLMLTQTTRARTIVTDFADEPAGWAYEPIEPGLSGVVSHADHGRIILVTGHQIITREKLEVLALGLANPPIDFLSLDETLDAVREGAGFPVLPWGFGKWWGARGKEIQRVVQSATRGELALGDNAGRPVGAPTPQLFGYAQRRGIPVLPGTDPLAIPGHTKRPARFGCRARINLDPLAPAASILHYFRELRESPKPFGSRTNPVTFVLDQVSIRARKAMNLGGVA